jgi:hypothetical protein
MNKRFNIFILFLILLLCFALSVQPIFGTNVSEGKVLAGQLNIISPANVTYNTNFVLLNVTSSFLLGPEYAKMCYSIDGQENVTIPLTGTRDPLPLEITYENGTTEIVYSTKYSFFDLNGIATLSGVSEGTHHIVVYANYTMNSVIGYDEKEVSFAIKTNSEASSIPEFPSWTILPIILVTTLCALVIKKRLFHQRVHS